MFLQPDVGGTPQGVPWQRDWDGSLWTLIWEAFCYIAVAGAGVVGLLSRRWFIAAALALALCWSALLPPSSFFGEEPPGTHGDIDVATVALVIAESAARFAVMFLAGALLYQFREAIPARWSLVALSVVLVLAAALMPNYHLLGAVPLAYAIIVSGALIHNKHLRLRTDLSYGVYIYAFPVQQLLVICGLGRMNPIVFAAIAAVATLPLAALSWIVVEKPAISLKSRLKRRDTAPAKEAPMV
jgi:peptidoglycan/LPS O-acetylase OafA/YrhL